MAVPDVLTVSVAELRSSVEVIVGPWAGDLHAPRPHRPETGSSGSGRQPRLRQCHQPSVQPISKSTRMYARGMDVAVGELQRPPSATDRTCSQRSRGCLHHADRGTPVARIIVTSSARPPTVGSGEGRQPLPRPGQSPVRIAGQRQNSPWLTLSANSDADGGSRVFRFQRLVELVIDGQIRPCRGALVCDAALSISSSSRCVLRSRRLPATMSITESNARWV